MLSNGDVKTLCHLNENKVIQKVECLNHVAKRLGAGLRKLVKGRSKSEDRIGGRVPGHLTEPVIKK